MAIVYVYRGTFDPFHNNHEAICQWCLEQGSGASVVIHINYKQPSATKAKNPASWDNRFDLVSAALNGLANPLAMVSPEKEFSSTIEWIIENHEPDTQIIQVLGDDVLHLLKDAPQVHAYAIHQRENPNSLESTKPLFNKARYNIPLELPNISSTQIRSLLIERNMKDVSTMVPSPVFLLLQNMEDYSPLHLSIQLLKKEKIFITPVFSQQLMAFFKRPIYLKHEPEMFSGLSGDVLVSVFCLKKGRIAVCKLFKQGADACLKEALGYEQLRTCVKTPDIYFVSENGFCIELILGIHAQSTHDFERVGLAYHQLHTQSMRDTEQRKPEKDVGLNNKILLLCNKISNQALSRNMKIVFDELLKTYLDNMRHPSTTHGDAQPGNILLSEHDVVFIDASGAGQWCDASRDFHQMVASIYWKAYTHEATEDVETIKNNIAAFSKGYGHVSDTPASKLWSLYWHTHSLLLALENPTIRLSKHIMASFKLDFPELALYLRNTSKHGSYSFWCEPQDICQPCNQTSVILGSCSGNSSS